MSDILHLMKAYIIALPVAILLMGISNSAFAEIGPDLFDNLHYLQGYWDPQDQSGLVAKSCREAARSNCDRVLMALKACTNMRVCNTTSIDDALESAMSALQKGGKNSPQYPALVFWISRIAPVTNINSGPRLNRLKRMGLEYQYNGIAQDWFLASTPLESLALERQNTEWGRQAFLEMTRNGWRAIPQCWIGNSIPVVIQRGEEFLRKYPKMEVAPGIVYALGVAYQDWYELVKAGMPERIGTGNLRAPTLDSETPRTKSIDYYTQYGQMIGKISESLRVTLDQLRKDISPQKDPLHSGEPYSCLGD
jgi:hypothetical protein